ncbi:MAG: ATP-binding protein [Gemmiger sp.]|uniref:sensor histidine kinase n=1 Tax=Gemmiger sp. TaxID=2049027 RepID=UPI002E790012|nr:ATP-binding protein [Gemmiger sp.]MEE0799832.1 ATP-binding protein [Gemmiger sp.]
MPEQERKVPRSMAGMLRAALIWVGMLSLVLSALGSAFLFHRAYAAQFDRDLARTAAAVAAGYQNADAPQPADLARFDTGLRLTLIAADGRVLYDSLTDDPASLPNHSDRAEVRAALESGSGQSVRKSETAGMETHYYALRLADGTVLRLADETSDVWGSYNHALPILLVGCLLIALLAAVMAGLIARRLVRPITRMAEHLDTIEADVPYEELIPLAHTVQSDRKLREDNETIRREFTANVSHELKTPLTSISGYAELIENGMARPEDIPGFGARIHKEARRMIALVSDILQLSELDGMSKDTSRDSTADFVTLDLESLVRDVASGMTMNARKAYVTLQYHASPAPVRGSRDLLNELATNLCDNAIRYNRPGGHVDLNCGIGPDGCPYLCVEDNGIGIPQDAQSRVFERFYRVDKSRSKATGGTGLGLAIVKHIAVLHNARIDLKSTVGTGTSVRVIFPKV